MSRDPSKRLPDVPGDPRPTWGTKEYWQWHRRNFANPREKAEKEELAKLRRQVAQAELPASNGGVIPTRHAFGGPEKRMAEFKEKEARQAQAAATENEPLQKYLAKLQARRDANQQGMSRWWEVAKRKARIVVINASRQLGKSDWAVSEVLDLAFTTPRAQIKYGASSKIQARQIIKPLFRALLEECPDEDYPTWVGEDQQYVFRNGATVTIIACDEHKAEAAAGQHAHLFVIDEAGKVDNLDFIVKSIALPMTTTTKGAVLIISTPARSKGHSFKSYCDVAKDKGVHLFRTIYDSDPKRVTDDDIRELCDACGGPTSTEWRREYLCEHITDENSAVVPEATSDRLKEITASDEMVKATMSLYVDRYIVVIPGWNPNFCGALFAHFDKRKERVVVEDELVLPKMDADALDEALSAKAYGCWGGQKPYRILAPMEDKLIVEMGELQWHFSALPPELSDVDIGKLRRSVTHKRGTKLIIHERCARLKTQLEDAVWNRTRKGFEPNKKEGRYELTACAIYLRRELNERHDPTPSGLEQHPAVGIVLPLDDKKDSKLARSVRSIFRLGRPR